MINYTRIHRYSENVYNNKTISCAETARRLSDHKQNPDVRLTRRACALIASVRRRRREM